MKKFLAILVIALTCLAFIGQISKCQAQSSIKINREGDLIVATSNPAGATLAVVNASQFSAVPYSSSIRVNLGVWSWVGTHADIKRPDGTAFGANQNAALLALKELGYQNTATQPVPTITTLASNGASRTVTAGKRMILIERLSGTVELTVNGTVVSYAADSPPPAPFVQTFDEATNTVYKCHAVTVKAVGSDAKVIVWEYN